MDFHGMKRKELQKLCKIHGIPANLKSVEMADRLASVFKEKESEEDSIGTENSSEDLLEKDSVEENLVLSKEIKKVKFSPENEVFEFTRSVKKRPRGSGRAQGESCAQDFQNAGKGVRRSKRNAAKGMSGDVSEPVETEKGSSRSSLDVTEEHNVVRQSKRITQNACGQEGIVVGLVADKLYRGDQRRLIEQLPVRSSRNDLEHGNGIMVKQWADEDIPKGSYLGIRVEELQTEVNTRNGSKLERNRKRSTRTTENVEEPIVQEVQNLFSEDDGVEERKARWSKRLAAGNSEGQSGENNVKDLLVDNEFHVTESHPGKNILDVSKVEKVPRRSGRTGKNVSVQNAAPEINNNKLTLVDGKTKSGKRGYVEIEKPPRRSKRLGPNDGSQRGAQNTHENDVHIDGQTQKNEQPPKISSASDFQDGKLLHRSKPIAVDGDAQVGAIKSEQLVKGQNQVAAEQQEGFTDDGPELGKAVRRSKRLSANEDEQIGSLRINAVEQDKEGKAQVASKQTRKFIQVGVGAGNNLRRTTRNAARADKGAGSSADDVKNSDANKEIKVPVRSTRNSSRHNSQIAQTVVEEKLVATKTEKVLDKPHAKAAGKMKHDRSGLIVDTEVVSSKSSLTLEELSAEYAQMEPEGAEMSNGAEVSYTKLTARSSSKKRKIVDQECTKENLQGPVEVSPSLSVTEAIKPVMSTENILDPLSEKSTGGSEGMDSQEMSSVLMVREHDQEHEHDSLVQDEMIEYTEKTLLLNQIHDIGLVVGACDYISGVRSEVKTCTVNSRSDVHLSEETDGQTTLVESEENKLKSQVVVDKEQILAKGSALTFLMKESTETEKENPVFTLESDLNESSVVAVAAAVSLKKTQNDEKGSVEKVIGAVEIHGGFSEFNSENKSGEEQTHSKVDCDISGGKTSSETATESITATSVEKMASKREETFDVTSHKIHSGVTDTESESMSKSSSIDHTNLSGMGEIFESAEEVYCIRSISNGSPAETSENFKEETLVSNTKHCAPTEVCAHVEERRDLQAKVVGSVTCKEIDGIALASDMTKEMAGKEAMLVSSAEEKMEEDLPAEDVEASLSLQNSKVSTDEEEKKAALGEVIFGHCENLEQPAQDKDHSLKKFEETNANDRGYKQEVLDLSGYPSTELASHGLAVEEASNPFEGETTSHSSQAISRPRTGRSHDESFFFTTRERNLMLREQFEESRKSFAATVTHYRNEAVKSPVEPVPFTCPEWHVQPRDHVVDEAANKEENIASEFHDESNISTISGKVLRLGSVGPNEGGKEWENTSAKFQDESVTVTGLQGHLSLRDFNQDGVKKNEENKDLEFHSVSGIFTTPERDLLLRETELDAEESTQLNLRDSNQDGDKKNEENKDMEFHSVSGIFITLERDLLLGDSELDAEGIQLSLRDSNEDGVEKNEENKDVEFHSVSGIFTTPERDLLLGDSEQGAAQSIQENKAAEFHTESDVFPGADRHNLLGDPVQDEARKQNENIGAEYHEESVISTSSERDLMLGDNKVEEAEQQEDNSAPKFQVESVVSTIPGECPLSEVSEPDKARKDKESMEEEMHDDECAICTISERNLLLGNTEIDSGRKGVNTAAKPPEASGIFASPDRHTVLQDCESSIFTSVERHLLFGDTAQHGAENKADSLAVKSHNQSLVLTISDSSQLLEDSEPDEARKNDQNKDMELDNESVSLTFTSAERCSTLGDSDLEKLGSKGDVSPSDVLTESEGNVVTIEGAEQTTPDLQVEMDQPDDEKIDLSHSSSRCVLSPKVMLKEDSLVTGRADIVCDTSENNNIDSNGSALCIDKSDFGQEAACREILQRDGEIEDLAGHVLMQETSNGSPGHVSQDESVNLVVPYSDGVETTMEVETSIGLDSHALALRTNDIEKGSGERNLLVGEESRPSIRSQDLMNEFDESPMITGDEIAKELIEGIIEEDKLKAQKIELFQPFVDNNAAKEPIEGVTEDDKLPKHEGLTIDPKTSETMTGVEKGSVENNVSVVADSSGHVEGGGTCFDPSSNLLDSEELGLPTHSLDAEEAVMVTSDEKDNTSTDELTEPTTEEEDKSSAEILDQSGKHKDYEGTVLSESATSNASAGTYVLAGYEDEHPEFDPEESSENASENSSHGNKSLDGKKNAPTVSEGNLPVFALQSNAHESVRTSVSISQAGPTLRNDINEQVADEKITVVTKTSALATPAKSSKLVNRDPDMYGTNTKFKRQQFSYLTKRGGVNREPSLIIGTQLKPARHGMKENAPSSKIAQSLNVTAPRAASKRRALQDLRNS